MIVSCYEAVREASHEMLEAARAGDWDALIASERRCAATIGRVQACGDDIASLDASTRKRAYEIIRAILANDAEIRDLTSPWLRQVELHLGTSRMSRKLAAAYRP